MNLIVIMLIISVLLGTGANSSKTETDHDRAVREAYEDVLDENTVHYEEKLRGLELSQEFGRKWSQSDFAGMSYEEFLDKAQNDKSWNGDEVAELVFQQDHIVLYVLAIYWADFYAVWQLNEANEYGIYKPITGASLS